MAGERSELVEVVQALLGSRGAPVPDAGGEAGALLGTFTAASRRVGKAPLALDAGEIARLAEIGVDWPLAASLDELWRVVLLLAAVTRADFPTVVTSCFRGGDTDERRAVLRALPLLPEPARFTSLAAEACRSSVQPIFEAIACENPYPARHLDPLHFEQMVLKALFLDVPLARIIGLAARRTPELARMARDYAAERRAAGRPVSADLAALGGEASS